MENIKHINVEIPLKRMLSEVVKRWHKHRWINVIPLCVILVLFRERETSLKWK